MEVLLRNILSENRNFQNHAYIIISWIYIYRFVCVFKGLEKN